MRADDALRVELVELRADMRNALIDIAHDPVTELALLAEPRDDLFDQMLDVDNARGKTLGAVMRRAIERRLIRTEHRQHRVALGGNALSRFVDRVGGATEQRVDRVRHVAGDLFEPRARGLACGLHPGDMRRELLRGAVRDGIGFTPALGERGELRVERRCMFARGDAGGLEQMR